MAYNGETVIVVSNIRLIVAKLFKIKSKIFDNFEHKGIQGKQNESPMWECKECANRSPNNGDMADKAKCDVVIEWVCDIFLILEKL